MACFECFSDIFKHHLHPERVVFFQEMAERGWKSGARSLSWESGWNPCILAVFGRWTYPKTFFRFRERVIWCLPAGVQLFYIYSILGSDRSHNPESALPLPIVDETASRQFIFSTFSFSAHQSHWHKQVFPFLRWFPCKWTEFNKKMNNAMWQSFRLGAVFIFSHGSGVGGQQMLKNHNEGHVHDFL